MARIRGLELLFSLIQPQLKSNEDCIVAALHCLLVNEGLQCFGIGDEWPESGLGTPTELLPKEWNANQEVYSLRYATKEPVKRYLLKVVKAGNTLHLNVAQNENQSFMSSINTDDYVTDNYSDYSNAYKDLDKLSDSFKTDIMKKFQSSQSMPTSSGSSSKILASESKTAPPVARPYSKFDSRLYEGPAVAKPYPQFGSEPYGADPFREPRSSFPRIGGADLDPFGMREGGMLMDPGSFGRSPLEDARFGGRGGLPRGAVPPGARFDPFGPMIPGLNRGPNPDHFRPPDFDDFM